MQDPIAKAIDPQRLCDVLKRWIPPRRSQTAVEIGGIAELRPIAEGFASASAELGPLGPPDRGHGDGLRRRRDTEAIRRVVDDRSEG
jgi:hypothetical protein